MYKAIGKVFLAVQHLRVALCIRKARVALDAYKLASLANRHTLQVPSGSDASPTAMPLRGTFYSRFA